MKPVYYLTIGTELYRPEGEIIFFPLLSEATWVAANLQHNGYKDVHVNLLPA